MSILLGPFERSSSLEKAKDEDVDDLLVFGYGCKLYRDDSKALLEDSGQLLIPWMGDTSLMIDRYVCWSSRFSPKYVGGRETIGAKSFAMC